ncbi:MAG: trehalose-phosphatase [Elusimicrobiota bacterium]|nr:MAG: trehalose-phosphatase [Elusimicrobiota bacterium]
MTPRPRKASAVPAGLLREVRASALRGEPLLAAFDFDGVLSPIRRFPGQARMSDRTRSLLKRLGEAKRTRTLIVSGRALRFLRRAAAGTGAALAGDHGLEFEGMGPPWKHPALDELARHARALARAARKATKRLKGVAVELKTATVSVHWRRAPSVRRDPEPLRALLESLAPPGWRVAPGLMLWELRPLVAWGKGHLIEYAQAGLGARILFVGDDHTDEEGFRRLGREAWCVRVGPGETSARWRLHGVEAVDELLTAALEARLQVEAAPAGRARERSSTRRAPQR